MTRKFLLASTTAFATLTAPQIVLAEITADDVWQNMKDYVTPLGGTISATPTRDGNSVTQSGMTVEFALPMGLGNVMLTQPDLQMTENGDGTVTISTPASAVYEFSAAMAGQANVTGNVTVDHQGLNMVASGDPGDVTYTYSIDELGFKLGALDVNAKDQPDIEVAFSGVIEDLLGTSRITIGDLVTVIADSGSGDVDVQYSAKGVDGADIRGTYRVDTAGAQQTMTFPRNGMDLMNLAAALDAGLSLTVDSRMTLYETTQVTESDGTTLSEQSSSALYQEARYEFDKDGLRISGDAENVTATMPASAEFPFPVDVAARTASGKLVMPLSARDNAQDFALALTMGEMEFGEDLWALVDPGQALPREPMQVELDLSGKVNNSIDWLNVLEVQSRLAGGEIPVELTALTMNTLLVDVAGARLTGTGAAVFDNSDKVTYGGFPKPVGAVDLALSGGNAMLDKLVAAGLVSDQDANGARMMMAVVAAPDPAAGEDAMKSRIEMTEQGHILANGQRLK